MALEREIKFFEGKRAEWLGVYPNKFVVVKGDEFVAACDSFEEALRVGIDRFGNQPFLVRQVTANEEKVTIPALTFGLIHAPAPAI
ncbi:MAG: hypothetical protein FJ395_00775 [Verrucomicrobia bacterium]|jgi:hypothetical protein|nr:hypothetical protein [Verrucomicrobiota bacterium]